MVIIVENEIYCEFHGIFNPIHLFVMNLLLLLVQILALSSSYIALYLFGSTLTRSAVRLFDPFKLFAFLISLVMKTLTEIIFCKNGCKNHKFLQVPIIMSYCIKCGPFKVILFNKQYKRTSSKNI